MTSMVASDWSKFFIADLTLMNINENFTLGQIWIWALFLIFLSRKPTSEAELTKKMFEALKERSDRGLFEKKNFKRCADKKLGFISSLFKSLIFTCSVALRPCCR